MTEGVTVRDRETGVPRPVRPGDVAILFRTRESHREFEEALARAGLPSYVYKGLGFFDSDEIKDLLALLWYLAEPSSDLRAAAFLRSRVVRLSDEGLRRLAPGLAAALTADDLPALETPLDQADAGRLAAARESSARWRALADRLPPAELVDLVLHECAYGVELRGPRFAAGAREPEEVPGARCAASRTVATRRSAGSRRISTGLPSATSRTPRSTRPTPST